VRLGATGKRKPRGKRCVSWAVSTRRGLSIHRPARILAAMTPATTTLIVSSDDETARAEHGVRAIPILAVEAPA